MSARQLSRYLPILDWSRGYSRSTLTNDLVAATIVTIMLIPQSLAYALLAGLPAEVGLYASMLPLVIYAVFGTSRTLAVGPVAVASLMTAAAIGGVSAAGTGEQLAAAAVLALLSGLFLVALGLLRLGFIAHFLSHPVISGFITASAIIIAASQLRHLLGIPGSGDTLLALAGSLVHGIGKANPATVAVGVSTLAFLFWARKGLKRALMRIGVGARAADLAAKAGPVAAVAATATAAWGLGLPGFGVETVGEIPRGLPPLSLPVFDADLWAALAGPALLISIIGFVESISIGQTLAAKRRQRIAPDQELIGLGAANIGAAVSGGYPVTGGFARSVVNFDAGAETPAAGAFTALGIALVTLTLTPALFYLPKATLAATIVVAVLSLADLSILRRAWVYSKADFAAVAATIAITLALGVETGVSAGVLISILLHLWKTSRPHVAEVGLVPGTEHFRNVRRHAVLTSPGVLTLRVDESLYFANAGFLQDLVFDRLAIDPSIRHVVLMCSAVNEVDMSALESLEAINDRLNELGLTLHLSEVKGPVMDRLKRSHFLDELTGQVFLTQYDAAIALDPGLDARAGAGAPRPRHRPAAE